MLLNGKYHAMARLQKYLVHTGTILILQLLVQYIVQRFGDLNHLLVRLLGEAYLTYNFTKCEFEIYIFNQKIYLKITSTRTNTLSQNNLNLRIKTEPVTAGRYATGYVWLLFNKVYLPHKPDMCIPLHLLQFHDRLVFMRIFISFWDNIGTMYIQMNYHFGI